MSGQAIQFLIQILPIAAGALFVLVLRGVKLPESGIQVRFSGEISENSVEDRKNKEVDVREPTTGLPIPCPEIYGRRELGEVAAIYRSPLSLHQAVSWHGYLGSFENMHDRVFERVIYDELITNGIFNPKTNSRNSHEIAFEKLSLLDAGKAKDLHKYLKRQKSAKLRLFSCGNTAFLRHTLSFDSSGGLLLAYLVNYDLEVIGA
jgi:hypothetical protein